MAGGIAILLLVILLLVIVGVALALSGTGGFLWWRKTDPERDRIADATGDSADGDSADGDRRPQHVRPTTPAQERTDFVGRGTRHG